MRTVPLGELTDLLSGFAFKSKRFGEDGDLPVIRIRDVVRGRSETFYSGDYDEKFLVKDSEILIGMDGEFNCARWNGGKALLNQRVCRIESTSDHLDDQYLYRFLPAALKAIERDTPFVTVKHLSAKTIRAIEIPLPPIEEQRRIAAVLDAADELRTKRRQALAKVDTLTQAIFIDMFGDPAEWHIEHELNDIVRPGDKINYGVVQPGGDFPNGCPLVRVSDLTGGAIDHGSIKLIDPDIEAKYGRSRLRGDEVLVSCVGSTGAVALASEAERGWNIARAVARVPADDRLVERAYLATYLRTPLVQRYFENELRTVSQPTLNIKQIKSTPLLLPSTVEQTSFVEASAQVVDHIHQQRLSLDRLDTLFASLQQRAFSGEL